MAGDVTWGERQEKAVERLSGQQVEAPQRPLEAGPPSVVEGVERRKPGWILHLETIRHTLFARQSP